MNSTTIIQSSLFGEPQVRAIKPRKRYVKVVRRPAVGKAQMELDFNYVPYMGLGLRGIMEDNLILITSNSTEASDEVDGSRVDRSRWMRERHGRPGAHL
jgi:hypothetical protein